MNPGYYQQPYHVTEQTQSYTSNLDSGYKSNTSTQNLGETYLNQQSSAYGNVNFAANTSTKQDPSAYQNYYYDVNNPNYMHPSSVATTSGSTLYSTSQPNAYSNYINAGQNALHYQAGTYQIDPKTTSYENSQSINQNSFYADSNTMTYMQTSNNPGSNVNNTQVSYTESYGNPQISYMSQNAYANPQVSNLNPQVSNINPQVSNVNPQAAYGNLETSFVNSQTGNTNQPVNLNTQTFYGNMQTSNVNPQTSYVNTDTSYGMQQVSYGENQYYGSKEGYNQIPYTAVSSYGNIQPSFTEAQNTYANPQPYTSTQTYTNTSVYGNNQTVYGNAQPSYGNTDAYSNNYGTQNSYANTSQSYYQDLSYNYGNNPSYQNVNNYAVTQQTSTTTTATKQQATVTTTTSTSTETSKKSSNVDLLAGLDFTISQTPLTPQVPSTNESKDTANVSQIQQTTSKTATKIEEKLEPVDNVKYLRPKKDPFSSVDILKQFANEIDKIEKFVNGLTNKTANGQTTLEMKWKFVQDSQDSDKRAISIARCYPLKNRYPDILPYDYSRVELKTTKDDYINATHLKVKSYLFKLLLVLSFYFSRRTSRVRHRLL